MDVILIKGSACAAAAVIIFLPIIITVFWKRKRNPLQKYEYGLAMYLSESDLWIGLSGTAVMYLFIIYGICSWSRDAGFWSNFLGILIFGILALIGTYGCICSMLEVIILEPDSLTIVVPFFPVKRIKFYELTCIRYYENRVYGYQGGRMILDGYIHTKRVFHIDESFSGFDYLYILLERTGKMEKPVIKEEFVVSELKKDINSRFLGVVLFGGCSVASIICKEEIELVYRIIVACLFFIFMLDLAGKLMWKVTVTYSTIYIRSKTGRSSSCAFRDITLVIEEEHYLVLYSGEKRILKVCKDFRNFDLLRNRLEAEHIVFERKD